MSKFPFLSKLQKDKMLHDTANTANISFIKVILIY